MTVIGLSPSPNAPSHKEWSLCVHGSDAHNAAENAEACSETGNDDAQGRNWFHDSIAIPGTPMFNSHSGE